jgi:beta-galactosidase
MLPHAGTATRTWREVTALGGQLAALPTLPAGTRDARVALVFDWENWWTVEASDHPQNQLDYLAVVQRWYGALHRRHVQVDIVPPERVDGQYALAIAPLLYLLRDEGAAALTAFVEGGGHLIAGPFTDVVDECDRFRDGGFLTPLGALCGVRVEDFGALVAPDAPVTALGQREARVSGAALGEVIGTLLAEEIEIEASDATVEASFTSGRRAGHAALTVRRAGRGVARYLATVPDEAGALAVIDHVLADSGVAPVVAGLPEHVEAARRGELVTLVHHGGDPVDLPIAGVDALTGERIESVRLEAFDWALVLQR